MFLLIGWLLISYLEGHTRDSASRGAKFGYSAVFDAMGRRSNLLDLHTHQCGPKDKGESKYASSTMIERPPRERNGTRERPRDVACVPKIRKSCQLERPEIHGDTTT